MKRLKLKCRKSRIKELNVIYNFRENKFLIDENFNKLMSKQNSNQFSTPLIQKKRTFVNKSKKITKLSGNNVQLKKLLRNFSCKDLLEFE